jgi:hypothetical protein
LYLSRMAKKLSKEQHGTAQLLKKSIYLLDF